jgi:hypothetical protein
MDPDPHRRVDYVCSVGESLYAFEHTGIEPFHDFIQRGIHNQALFSAVVNHFDNTRPDAQYWRLYVPFEASASVKTVQVKRVGAALIAWIEQNAAAVPVVIYGNRFRDVLAQTAAGIPFPFSLHRFSFDSIHFPTECPTRNEFRLFKTLLDTPAFRRNDEWGGVVCPQLSAHFRSASKCPNFSRIGCFNHAPIS